jgi:hypothetical protein
VPEESKDAVRRRMTMLVGFEEPVRVYEVEWRE